MQSTDLDEICVSTVEASSSSLYTGKLGMAQVMAVRRRCGQLLVQLRGRKRWYEVSAVAIAHAKAVSNQRM